MVSVRFVPAIEGNPAARSAHAAFAIMQSRRSSSYRFRLDWDLQFRVIIASGLMVIMPTEHQRGRGSGECHAISQLA